MSLRYWSEAQNIICLSREVFIEGTRGTECKGIGRREHAQEDRESLLPLTIQNEMFLFSPLTLCQGLDLLPSCLSTSAVRKEDAT